MSEFLTNESQDEMAYLTIEELVYLDTLLRERGIDLDIATEAPVRLNKAHAQLDSYDGSSDAGLASLGRWSYKPGFLLILEQQGRCKLSDETRALEEEWLAKTLHKAKALRNRKRYTRKRGTVHPKKKEATRRRTRMIRRAKEPFHCLLARDRRKCKRIDKELWFQLVQPLWSKYDPHYLTIDFPERAGTRANPWTLWNMTIKYKNEVVWKGEDEYLYYLSGAGSVPSPM